MNIQVVDSSVAAKWVFEEVHTDKAFRLLDEGSGLHAPDLFLVETDNIVCKRVRRNQIDADEGQRIRAALREFPVRKHTSMPLLDEAYLIAIKTGRSIYDCLYLALAELLHKQMVTADRRLYDALKPGPFAQHIKWIEDIK